MDSKSLLRFGKGSNPHPPSLKVNTQKFRAKQQSIYIIYKHTNRLISVRTKHHKASQFWGRKRLGVKLDSWDSKVHIYIKAILLFKICLLMKWSRHIYLIPSGRISRQHLQQGPTRRTPIHTLNHHTHATQFRPPLPTPTPAPILSL